MSIEKDTATRILEALNHVYSYADGVDDWITIKKELLKILIAKDRTLFSTRHPITKKQQTNDFERSVAKRWSVLTGRSVIFNTNEQQEID